MMRLVDVNLTNRIEKTVFIGTCWLVFVIFFLTFNPIGLNIFQSIAVFLASGFIAIGAVALTWVTVLNGE